MTLPENQINQIKKQILSQLENSSVNNKEEIKKSIEAMNAQELEEFLKQNNLIKSGKNQEQCIFCAIANNKTESIKLDENEHAVAILEINPLSKGHTIVMPKTHVQENPPEVEKLAKKIKRKIKLALNPKDIILEHGSLFDHAIINVIPVYGEELEKERKKADTNELKELQKKIISIPDEEKKMEPKKEEEIITEENTLLPNRIP